MCRVLLSLSYVPQKRQWRGKRSTLCPDPIPLYIPCTAEGEKKGADSNGAKKNEFCWINLWSILWVIQFLRHWNVSLGKYFWWAVKWDKARCGDDRAIHIITTFAPDSFTSSIQGLFARYWTLVTQKASYVSKEMLCVPIFVTVGYTAIQVWEETFHLSQFEIQEGRRESNISEFQSGVYLKMKRPGFRVPGSVVRITLQDFMTYRHE